MRNRFLALILITSLCAIAIPAQGEVVSSESKMKLIKTINGSISPKSVRSSGDGVVSAHNMMYRHSVIVGNCAIDGFWSSDVLAIAALVAGFET